MFSSAIHDVRYRLSWGLLIQAMETGERVLIPYVWEQIGSKCLTSSQMQRRSLAGVVRAAARALCADIGPTLGFIAAGSTDLAQSTQIPRPTVPSTPPPRPPPPRAHSLS